MAVSPVQDVVRFGLFELDLKAGQLSRNGMKLRLPQQPLQVLALLLERPGGVVTREELRRRLWSSDVFVDFDHGLNKSVQKLRDALGDSATSPRYIETIPRVGYRFIAPVSNGIRQPEQQAEIQIASPVAQPVAVPAPVAPGKQTARWWLLGAGVLAACALITAVYSLFPPRPPILKFTQLTDFTDSATAPALSPDGNIVAFIRGGRPFGTTAPIYVKMLPDGEARLIADDARAKYNLAFSPDGSQIAYTVWDTPSFATYTVSVLGSDSHLLLKNAGGLSWLDAHHYLFSRIRSGLHMGIVTQSVAGDNFRELYYPSHERGMAHYSYPSPDRGSALVVEMNGQGVFASCRLISLAGRSPARPVGPDGSCTSAGWSPDGSWMYFIATVEGQSHLWRQRFPYGQPEQLTFGPTEEQGVAVDPDGRSLITSMGVDESTIWIHDTAGERSMSSEGEVLGEDVHVPPAFSPDGKTLYYLLRHHAANPGTELWRMRVDSGKSEAVFPGVSMFAYDISPDGKQVVYSTEVRDGKSQLWLAAIDKSSPARQIGHSGERSPHFGPRGKILFQFEEGNANYVGQMKHDGSSCSKVVPYPITEIQSISPARKWLVAMVPYPEGANAAPMVMAIPLDGGPPRRLCADYCLPAWSSSGKFLFIPVEWSSRTSPGRSLAIPLGPGETLPTLPPAGIPAGANTSILTGAQSVNRALIVPGEDLAHYAYLHTAAHRNLYRISLP